MKKFITIAVSALVVLILIGWLLDDSEDSGSSVASNSSVQSVWKANASNATYEFTFYADGNCEMVAGSPSGGSKRKNMFKGTFTGDTTRDTGDSNKVRVSVTHMWKGNKWESSERRGEATISGNKLTFPIVPDTFTRQ